MAYNAANIELGEGILELKGTGDADFVDIGGTQGGDFSYNPSFKDIEIGQAFASVKSVMIGEEGTLKVKVVESTMRNLAIAIGLDPSSIGSSGSADLIEFGGYKAAQYLEGRYTVAQVDTPTKYYRFRFYKLRVASGLALPFTKSDERAFEVTFKLFASQDHAGALGVIEKDR